MKGQFGHIIEFHEVLSNYCVFREKFGHFKGFGCIVLHLMSFGSDFGHFNEFSYRVNFGDFNGFG